MDVTMTSYAEGDTAMSAYAAWARVPIPVRRLIYRCAYLTLCAYWFIRRPRLTGVKCVLTDGERVLLVRHTYGPREWDLPGGGIKREESPADAARREMHEELGISADWVALGEVFAVMHHRSGSLHCFQAEVRNRGVTLDLGELATAGWFAPNELPTNTSRHVRRILARAR